MVKSLHIALAYLAAQGLAQPLKGRAESCDNSDCSACSDHSASPCGDVTSPQGQQQDQAQQQAPPAAPIPAEICNASPSDTDSAFLGNATYTDQANAAATPQGFYQSFKAMNTIVHGIPAAASPLAIHTLDSYDTESCAVLCRQKSDCVSFNIYVERGHMVTPCDTCPNPSSQPRYICVSFKQPICASEATNDNQWRHKFHVVHAGSNGYNMEGVPVTCGGAQTSDQSDEPESSSASQTQTSLIPLPTQSSQGQESHPTPSVLRRPGFRENYAYPTQAFSIPNYDGVWTAIPTTAPDGGVQTVFEPCTKTDLTTTVVVTDVAAQPTGSSSSHETSFWRFKPGKTRSKEHWKYKPGHGHHEDHWKYKLKQKGRGSLNLVTSTEDHTNQDGWTWDAKHKVWYSYTPAEVSESHHHHHSKLGYDHKSKHSDHEHLKASSHRHHHHHSSTDGEGWYWNPKSEEWYYYTPAVVSEPNAHTKLDYDHKSKHSDHEHLKASKDSHDDHSVSLSAGIH